MGYRIDLLSLGARFLEEPILTLASTKLISTTLSGFLGPFSFSYKRLDANVGTDSVV